MRMRYIIHMGEPDTIPLHPLLDLDWTLHLCCQTCYGPDADNCLTVITNAAYGTVIYDDVQVDTSEGWSGIVCNIWIGDCGAYCTSCTGPSSFTSCYSIRTCPAVCALSYGLFWISLLDYNDSVDLKTAPHADLLRPAIPGEKPS